MAEYIDRQAAIEAVCGCVPHSCDIGSCGFACSEAYAISKLPSADVRPVVKARWVYTDMSRLVCSNCGSPVAFALKEDGWHHGDYCPNCGADMREV